MKYNLAILYLKNKKEKKMMDVVNKIKIYEIDDEEVESNEDKFLTISSHWNEKDMVNIQIEDGKIVTVSATDLYKAIENATNK